MGVSFAGSAGQYYCSGASRSSFPCCHSKSAAIAVIGFETEASSYSVCEVAGTAFSRSALPNPADHSSTPFSTTATETPGVLLAAINREIAASSCARFAGGIFAACANAAALENKKAIARITETLPTAKCAQVRRQVEP